MDLQVSGKAKMKKVIVLLSIVCLFTTTAFSFVFIREGYPQRLLKKYGRGVSVSDPFDQYLIKGWEQSLAPYDADIVFYGDSITRGGDWYNVFPSSKVCNLGVAGDSIEGLIQRLPLIDALDAKIIFLMIGVNNTSRVGWEEYISQSYDVLLSKLAERGITVYVQSVLPVRTPSKVSNSRILRINEIISSLAEKHSFVYIDVYKNMVNRDGELEEKYSKDGVHLNEKGYEIWYNILRSYLKDEVRE